MSEPRVFAVSGTSGTGKTTVTVKLIHELKARGHAVASVKSSSKDIEPQVGKDTQKHWDAGSDMSVFLGPTTTEAMFRKRLNLKDIIEESIDYIIVEGAKGSNIPKFWHIGTDKEVGELPSNVVAILRQSGADHQITLQEGVDVPQFWDNEISKLVDVIETIAVSLSLVDV